MVRGVDSAREEPSSSRDARDLAVDVPGHVAELACSAFAGEVEGQLSLRAAEHIEPEAAGPAQQSQKI